MNRSFCLLLTALVLQYSTATHGGDITADGKQLEKKLDAMHVEKLWLSEKYVNWETGEALKKEVTNGKHHNHCSAFVAAACKKMNVYILRPPEHSTLDLANAQCDWLNKEGRREGWKPVASAWLAQQAANKGKVVVAAFREKDNKPGHIAIVRPSIRPEESIKKDGPQIIQAGLTNYNSTTASEGFKNHPAAWGGRKMQFFTYSARNVPSAR